MADTSLVFNLLAKDKTGSGMSSAKKKFAALGAVAGTAVAGFAVSSVKAFADFDQSMTQSLAIMGDVSDDMKGKMSSAAREVGKTTTFSAKEAADSYFFLASAGMDAKQAIAAMPQVAKFAQAGMFDMATATDLATDAQSALGLSSKDAEQNVANLSRVTDVFVKANTLANTSVQQISEAITNKAGAAMRSVGIDIEEGSAVLAAFADQGLKGAAAGTNFAIVLRDLQTQALKHKDTFKKAGVAVYDAKGEFRSMADIVGDLEGSLDGLSDAQKKAKLSTLGFSDKSMSSLQTLLGTSGNIRKYEKELRKAGGTTDEIAKKQLESFSAKVKLLKARFQDLQITVGQKIVPVLLVLAKGIGKVMAWFGRHDVMGRFSRLIQANVLPVLKRFGAWFMVVALPAIQRFGRKLWSDLQPALRQISKTAREDLLPAVQGLIEKFKQAWPEIQRVLAILAAVAGFILREIVPVLIRLYGKYLRIWITVLGYVFLALWKVIGALINIGKAVGEAGVAFWRFSVKVKDAVVGAKDFVVDAFKAMVGFITKMPGRISNAASGMFDGIKNAFRSAVNWLVDKWNAISFSLGGGSYDPLGKFGPTISVPGFTLSTPDIPRLAKGGNVTSAGLALVGERGPELLSLNRGAQVTPLGGAGRRTVIEFDFTGADADLVRMFRKAIRVRGGNVQIVLGGNR